MKMRTAIKKDKRRYKDMYKDFCRFVSDSPEYRGSIKDGRGRIKAIMRRVRGSIKMLIDLKHYMAEHP